MVAAGDFRKDLFYRLNVVPILIPPLRDRPGDIPFLAKHFQEKYVEKFRKNEFEFTPELNEYLLKYTWPGNVRELEHFIEKLVLISETGNLHLDMLTLSSPGDHEMEVPESEGMGKFFENDFQSFLNESENAYFSYLMERYRGDVQKMSDHAQTAKKTIYAKIKRYSLKSR